MTKHSRPLQTLSVKDIARGIKRPHEELQAAIDRLRNWTDLGLIHQVGEKNPGTGRARRYSHDTLLEAALLDVLTGAVGMPAVLAVPHLRGIKKQLIAEDWKAALEGVSGQDSLDRPFLVIGRLIGERGTLTTRVLLKDLPQHLQHLLAKRYDAHVLIDLRLIFDRLLRPLDDDPA
jgi:hypothetical protein